MNVIVGVSDLQVTNDLTKSLITYALGSCVGLTLYDPVAQVGGLIHCMLPLSKIDPSRAEERPAMFVDTGVLAVLRQMIELKATKENMIACVAGAASPLDIEGAAKIGERNLVVLRKLLWKNDLLITAEEVGGGRTHGRCH